MANKVLDTVVDVDAVSAMTRQILKIIDDHRKSGDLTVEVDCLSALACVAAKVIEDGRKTAFPALADHAREWFLRDLDQWINGWRRRHD